MLDLIPREVILTVVAYAAGLTSLFQWFRFLL